MYYTMLIKLWPAFSSTANKEINLQTANIDITDLLQAEAIHKPNNMFV